MSVETVTLGCRLNFAESETIAQSAPAGEDWSEDGFTRLARAERRRSP